MTPRLTPLMKNFSLVDIAYYYDTTLEKVACYPTSFNTYAGET